MGLGMSISEYAAHRAKHNLVGAARSSVYAALERGVFARLPDGSIDAMAADVAWAAWHVRPDDERPASSGPSGEGVDYNAERAQHERAKRELAELKLAQARAESVDAATAARDWFDLSRTVRDRMLGIPADVASQVATMTDPHAVETLLLERITEALASLAEMPLGEVGDDDDDEPE